MKFKDMFKKVCRCRKSVVVEARFLAVGFGYYQKCGQHYFINFDEEKLLKVSPAWYNTTLAEFNRIYGNVNTYDGGVLW